MATRPAILGTMRLANARLGYNPTALAALRATRIRVYIAGVVVNDRVRRAVLAIRDVINETPSTCAFVADTVAPTVAQTMRVTINSDTPRLLFNGAIQAVDTSYEAGKKTNLVYTGSATDDMERLKRRRPFGTWTNISATTVVAELAALYAPGFTTTHVQASLPAVTINLDGSEGWDGALRQIAGLIGGYYYIEDLDIHLFQSEATDTPDPIDVSHRFANAPAISITRDLSQLRTRVYGKGYGTTVPTDVAIGETILPVDNADLFNPAGGKAIAVTQRLDYTGVQTGGAGSLVGPAAVPAVALSAVVALGTGATVGAHDYAYTWVTGAGETVPSPLWSLVIGTPTAPSVAPTVNAAGQAGFYTDANINAGDHVDYAYSWSTASSINELTQETALSPITSIVAQADPTYPSLTRAPIVGVQGSADSRVHWVRWWRSINGGPYLLMTMPGTGARGFANSNGPISSFDGNSGSETHSAATLQQAALSAIAVGPSGTTSRKVYRTAAGGSQLKLLTTIANNTTTTFADSTADGSLGANAPTSDTSGLSIADGQVNAGSTSLLTASVGPFSASGGWANLGSQLIRYTGVSGNTLTGIPANGPGALISSVRYGEHVDPSPALTGVTGIAVAIATGSTVNIWVQRDDVTAQTDMAATDGGDGIYEFLVSDERRAEASLIALCDANLALFSRPIVTVKYATRDVKTKSGKPITVTGILGYTGTLTIQDVSIAEIDCYPGTPPKFTVTASSVRVSLEALLRQLIGEAA